MDVPKVVPGVVIDMPYATTNNFLGRAVYPSQTALLRRGTAEKLAVAARALQTQGYRVKVWDAYRPLSVQWEMWRILPNPVYVADPRVGSRHNRGAAVDCTLVDGRGGELLMPSSLDAFGPRAARRSPMDPAARRNLDLLEGAMKDAGFVPYPEEWWHYDDSDWSEYGVLDVPFPESPPMTLDHEGLSTSAAKSHRIP